MSGAEPNTLQPHLQACVTTVCSAWLIERLDGVTLGFTDHDLDLTFDGVTFRADAGLSAMALQQSSGLSIDNTEALGALRDEAIREDDIAAGLFDGAEVTSWHVNWADVSARKLVFRGTIGEIRRGDSAFEAELRGLTEALNVPQGRMYQKGCGAVLGDARCGFDVTTPGYFAEREMETQTDARVFGFADFLGFDDGFFQRGRLIVNSGAAAGQVGVIKRDILTGKSREVELWQPLRGDLVVGDMIRLEAGCDKRLVTCAKKFNNVLNFQGFPHLPGEDWLSAVPKSSGNNTGGSLS